MSDRKPPGAQPQIYKSEVQVRLQGHRIDAVTRRNGEIAP
jgi:hypothetical protein